MSTTTTTSQAHRMADSIAYYRAGEMMIGPPPAPQTVNHQNYTVSYYSDSSILITSRHGDVVVLDDNRIYYRDVVEHLARCLGLMTQEQRRGIITARYNGEDAWIDGILWLADGSFGGI